METSTKLVIWFFIGFLTGIFLKEKIIRSFKYLFVPKKFMIEGYYIRSWTEPTSVPTCSYSNDSLYVWNIPQWTTIDIDYLLIKDEFQNEIVLTISHLLLFKIKNQYKEGKEIIVSCRKFEYEELPEVIKVI
jgi:hypothetical protein